MVSAVNIPPLSSSSSSRSTSLSSAPPSPNKPRMPYTPTSAMSTSAVYINDSGAGALSVQEVHEASMPRTSDTPRKLKKELFVEVPKKRPDVDEMPSVLPSPPLTRVGTNESRSTRGVLRGEEEVMMEEVDVTAWRESTQRADEEDEEVYIDEDSPESPNLARNSLFPTAKDPLEALRVNVPPVAPSPPLWEVVSPPESNNNHSMSASRHDLVTELERAETRAASSKRLVPKSSYYYGPPPVDAAYGTEPIGQIGVHHPREVVRIERDYSGGELIQFAPVYPLEFEGRITATRFLESINLVNEILISAHSLRHSCFDISLAFLTFQLSKLVKTSHYEKEMRRLKELIDSLNVELFNPVGLNMVWPRKVAFMFLEIEYY